MPKCETSVTILLYSLHKIYCIHIQKIKEKEKLLSTFPSKSSNSGTLAVNHYGAKYNEVNTQILRRVIQNLGVPSSLSKIRLFKLMSYMTGKKF